MYNNIKGGDTVAIKESNKQVSIVLPKEIIEKIDKLADDNYLTRSQQCARIIIEYIKKPI